MSGHIEGAWVTLLTNPDYLMGVKALRNSMKRIGTRYPLVVMVTSRVDVSIRRELSASGCEVQDVDSLGPPRHLVTNYVYSRFAEVWTKLRVFGLTEYQRVVYLDADMLLLRDMDELFTTPFAPGERIAAVSDCLCNPDGVSMNIAQRGPENCPYTDHSTPKLDHRTRYFNAGLIVLSPDTGLFAGLVDYLANRDDMASYKFAEQDLLNEYLANQWHPLPYTYNALTKISETHSGMWSINDVRNLHFAQEKPWKIDPSTLDDSHPQSALFATWWQIYES